MPAARQRSRASAIAWAVVAMMVGASVLALMPIALERFGTDWKVRFARAGKPISNPRKEAAGIAR